MREPSLEEVLDCSDISLKEQEFKFQTAKVRICLDLELPFFYPPIFGILTNPIKLSS